MKSKNPIFHAKKIATMICIFAAPLSAAHAMTYLAPIVVDDAYIAQYGNVISNSYQGTLTQPAITIKTSAPVIIQNSTVSGPGDLIYAEGANLTVTNTTGIGTNPNQVNVQKGMFVHVEGAKNLVVSNCSVYETRFGVYIQNYVGDRSVNQTIKILNNTLTNIDGRPSNGSNGYAKSGSYNAKAIQLTGVQAVPGMEIANNKIVSLPYQSQMGNGIEIFSSSGVANSHLLIHDNFIQGAYPANPGVDAYSGGGLIVNGKSTDTAATASGFVDIYSNKIVSTSNYGMAVAAGHDIDAYNNTIVSSGYLADCVLSARAGAVGMYNWNYYNQPATVFFNNHLHDNTVGLVGPNNAGVLQRNDMWLPGQQNNRENNLNWIPNDVNNPTVTDENNVSLSWTKAMAAAHKKIGTQGGDVYAALNSAKIMQSASHARCAIRK